MKKSFLLIMVCCAVQSTVWSKTSVNQGGFFASVGQSVADRVNATIVSPVRNAKQKFAAKVRHRVNQKEHQVKENIKHRAEHAAIHGVEDVAEGGAYLVFSGGVKKGVENAVIAHEENKHLGTHESKWDIAFDRQY